MAVLPISLGALISILSVSGRLIYGAAEITSNGIGSINSKHSHTLVKRCSEIVEDLQQMDHKILGTGRAQTVVQTVINSLNWAKKYEKKKIIIKIIFSNKYEKKFKDHHEYLTQYFNDLVLSTLLTRTYPDIPSPKISSDLYFKKSHSVDVNLSNLYQNNNDNLKKSISFDANCIKYTLANNTTDNLLDSNLLIFPDTFNKKKESLSDNLDTSKKMKESYNLNEFNYISPNSNTYLLNNILDENLLEKTLEPKKSRLVDDKYAIESNTNNLFDTKEKQIANNNIPKKNISTVTKSNFNFISPNKIQLHNNHLTNKLQSSDNNFNKNYLINNLQPLNNGLTNKNHLINNLQSLDSDLINLSNNLQSFDNDLTNNLQPLDNDLTNKNHSTNNLQPLDNGLTNKNHLTNNLQSLDNGLTNKNHLQLHGDNNITNANPTADDNQNFNMLIVSEDNNKNKISKTKNISIENASLKIKISFY